MRIDHTQKMTLTKFILLFMIGLIPLAAVYSQPAGYAHRKLITLNSSQISGSTSHTDFPVLVDITDSDLKSSANSGGIVSPSGYDIVFTESDGSTLLTHELQNYDAVSGQVIAWVKIPSLSPTVDTDIYLYFGKSGIYTDPSDTTTWNNNFIGVWHLDNLTDAAGIHALTDHNTSDTTNGYIGHCRAFDGDGDDLETVAGETFLDGLSSFSISLWARADAVGTDRGLIFGRDPDGKDRRICIRHDAAGAQGGGTNLFRSSMTVGTNTTYQKHESSNGSASTSWQYITLTRSSGNATKFYIDGSLDVNAWETVNSGTTRKNTKLIIGKGSKDGAASSWDGLIDEVRISNVELSADWVATEHTNMSSPGTFHTVATTNELPALSQLESIALSYQSNDPATLVTTSIACTDFSDLNLDSANIQITGNYLSSEDTLTFANAYGITGEWQDSNGTLRLTGNASLSDYSSALQEIYYFNSNATPSTATRTISFKVNDGDAFSATVTRDISMNAVNNAPVLASIEGTTLAYVDGDPDTIITATLALSDVDDYYLDTTWVTISSNFTSGEDQLAFTSAYGISASWSNTTGILILTGSAPLTDYQLALRSVTYENLDPDPSTTTRTISYQVTDGAAHSNTLSRDVSVTAVNDAPILSEIEASGLVYNAGDGAVALSGSITVTDGDNVNIDSANVQISVNYYTGEDTLVYSSVYGVTGTWLPGAGTLKLVGTTTTANYTTILRSITYENVLGTPHTPTRTISFTVSDGLLFSSSAIRSIAAGEPATIPNLDLWLNASDGVYSDGAGTTVAIEADPVEVWKDQSGNNRDFVNNNGNPLWRQTVAGLNGESALEWSGGLESMRDADGEAYINGKTELTAFFVIKSDLTSTDKGLWSVANPNGNDRKFSIRYDAIGDNSSAVNSIKTAVLVNGTANQLESSEQMQSTNAQILCMDWKSGEVWSLYVDGVLNSPAHYVSPPAGSIVNSDKVILGRGPTDTAGGWDGMIAEVVVYNRHLTNSERQSVEDYFSDKYAISVRLTEPAAGGESTSADDANTTYTTLTGPRITEDFSGELALSGTIIFTAPTGYEWDTGGATPSVTVQEAYGLSTTLAASYTSRTTSQITFTIDTQSVPASQPGEMLFSGLKIRPTTGIVPNSGSIHNVGTTGPNGDTDFGTLTMVAGTPTQVVYIQSPPAGTMDEILAPPIIAEIRDVSGNPMEIAGTAVTISISSGTGTLTGTTTLYTDAGGQVTFSNLVIDAADTFTLTTASSGLTSAVSSAFDVSNPGQFVTFLVEKISGGNILTQVAGVDFSVKISAVDGSNAVDASFTGQVDITSDGILSNGSGTTGAFTAGVLNPYIISLSSVGDYKITATNDAGSETGNSNTFTVESGPASAIVSTITASPTVLENDAVSLSMITVQIKDAGGNDHDAGGETVNLIASAGTLVGSVTDNGDGSYSQDLRSSSSIEAATITGVLNGNAMSDSANVQFNAYTNIWESDPGSDPYTTRWDTLVNWDNTIPLVTDKVLIPASPADNTNYPIITTDNEQVASLTIEGGADLTLTGSISFHILGDLGGSGDINGGLLDTVRVQGDMGIGSSSIKNLELNGSTLQNLTSPASFTNLAVDNSAGVRTISNLEVTGTLKLTNGTLTVGSGYSLIANTKSITSGDIQMQREIIGDTGWRLLAAPVTSTYGDFFDAIYTQGYTGSDSVSGSPSILFYDETYVGTDNQRWRKLSNSTDATVPGRGLFVYVFGSIDGEVAYSQALPTTLGVTGSESEGSGGEFDFGVTYTAAADTGWNLIGNPFCASIDWDDAGWTKTNMDNVIYVWDNTANSGAGAYLTWNGTSGSLGDGLIPPFQGFWVKANASSPSLKVPKTAKTTGGVFYKSSAEPNPLMVFLLEADTLSATSHIQFDDRASRYKDSKDAYSLIPPTQTYLHLSSQSRENLSLSIQNHPYRFGRIVEIDLDVGGYIDGNPYSGSYKLSWPRIEGLPQEWDVSIRDNENGEITQLSTTASYEFDAPGVTLQKLRDLSPSNKLTQTQPFRLRRVSAQQSPRFTLMIDPQDAFPEIPREFSMNQNYPNPFNEGTTFRFELPLDDAVSLTLYDIRGREVVQLIDSQSYGAGKHTFKWQSRDLSSGIYIYRLSVGSLHFSKKLILLR